MNKHNRYTVLLRICATRSVLRRFLQSLISFFSSYLHLFLTFVTSQHLLVRISELFEIHHEPFLVDLYTLPRSASPHLSAMFSRYSRNGKFVLVKATGFFRKECQAREAELKFAVVAARKDFSVRDGAWPNLTCRSAPIKIRN
jgi:hypothetical protein